MKKPLILAAIVVVMSTALLRAVPYTPLVHHGHSANRVDLVIMGDGYTSTDLGNGLFARDAARAVAEIFSRDPYKEYEPYFNVWRMDVMSPESGADHPHAGIYRATTLDASYDCPGATDVCVSPAKVSSVIASTGIASDLVLVIVNDGAYGYTAPPMSTTFVRSPHVVSNNPANLPQILADSSDVIVRRLYSVVRPFDRFTSSTNSILKGARLPIPEVQLTRPATHALHLEWQIDDKPVASDGFTLDTSKLLPGRHVVTAVVSDVTPLVSGGILRFTQAEIFNIQRLGSFAVTPNDFDGDGRSEVAVFDRQAGGFLVEGGRRVDWGRRGDIPAPADYDGDERIDLTVFRPATGTWYIPGRAPMQLGGPGDIPVPNDGGNVTVTGIAEPRILRPFDSTISGWIYSPRGAVRPVPRGGIPLLPWTKNAFSEGSWVPWVGLFVPNYPSAAYLGMPGDVPVPSNFIGGPTADWAVFRPSTGVWYISEFDPSTGGAQPIHQYRWGAAGDVPVLLDRDGDGLSELGVFRRSSSHWYFWNLRTNQTETIQLGRVGDFPLGAPAAWWLARTGGDADGDRRADLVVFRPSTTQWLFDLSGGSRGALGCTSQCTNPSFAKTSTVTWGLATDIAVAADYDGDHRLDPAVFRPSDGTWRILNSASDYTTSTTTEWGLNGDIGLPADYDADGKDDVAVFRPSTGRWYVRLSAGGTIVRDWGLNGDEPVPADYDGDGRADLAVFRPSTGLWYILDRFENTYETRQWGLAGDVPMQADYDGDLKADEAVFRPSEGRWYVRLSGNSKYAISDWGVAGDIPQAADYDGDGRADVAVFRPSTGRWYVMNGLTADWGLPGDVPVTRGR